MTCLELALEEEKVFDSGGGLGMLEENKKPAGVWCKRLSRHPPILGPRLPAGATFNMADWPPSTTIEMNLLASNLEDDHTWEGSRWVEFEKIRPGAKNWKTTISRGGETCYSLLQLATIHYNLLQLAATSYNLLQLATIYYNLLQLTTTCYNWPKPAAQLATTQLRLLVWRELVELRFPMEASQVTQVGILFYFALFCLKSFYLFFGGVLWKTSAPRPKIVKKKTLDNKMMKER